MTDDVHAAAVRWRLRGTAAVSAAEAAAITAAVAAAEREDGVEPVGDGPVRSLEGGAGVRHIIAEDVSGGLSGYANVDGPGSGSAMIEAFTVPEARGQGIGSALIERAFRVAGPGARAWAHGAGAAAAAVAARMGLVPVRELLQMTRPLNDPPLPPVAVPAGVRVRTFAEPDAPELLRVNNAAFSWHPEQGGMTTQDLADERAQSWFDPGGLFLAFDDDGAGGPGAGAGGGDDARGGRASAATRRGLLGFHWTKVHPPVPGDDTHEGAPAVGEVYVVGVDPAAQGRGLGAALTLTGLHHLRDAGMDSVMLYVEADNTAAVRTYERLGFVRSRTDLAYGRPG